MTSDWAWLLVVALGAFHGLNPAMGWLFAVGLALHSGRRRTVALAIVPIALGHATAVAAVAALFIATGLVLDATVIRWTSAGLLAAWAGYCALSPHRARVRFGMQVGIAGLFVWSFLVATAHGAGLMLLPALTPLCTTVGGDIAGARAMTTAAAVVSVHTIAMLVTTTLIALCVYEWVGVAVLRRGWINFDRLWILALLATAILMLVL